MSSDREFRDVKTALENFKIFEATDSRLVVSAASNYRHLRSKGITVRSTIDCLIATFCIENGHSLLHRDRDYNAFEQVLGMQVVHAVDA